MSQPTLLTGWGRAAPTAATVVRVADDDDVEAAIKAVDERGVVARGLGRSYGDQSQNAGGAVLDMTARRGAGVLEAATGVLDVDAGTSLDDLLRELVPQGWFVPVTPGTRHVTIGGSLACDIHGKNHHVDGSFANHVLDADLLLPSGERRSIGPDREADLFWATAGGLGLTGIISRCRVRLLPIETSRMLVDTDRAGDLDHLMALMDEGDHRYRYSVAWLDLLARGRSLGRGVLTRGDHAPAAALTGTNREHRLDYAPQARLSAPSFVPGGLLNRASIRAFNEVWFRKAPARRRDELQTIPWFFHPLDAVRGWNRMYGPGGFLQYQFVVPFGAEPVLERLVAQLSGAGVGSFLAVLKRFGAGNQGLLSFPMPGWTLTVDVPTRWEGLPELLDGFDDEVVAAGGRVYLAKDSRLDPAHLAAMYPRLDEWRTVRDAVDPDHVLQSDLGRRLGLCGAPSR